jgi:hypothetical protein
MARTRTPGIRVDRDGRRIIDKDYRGVAIYLRLGPITQENAEQRLGTRLPESMLSFSAMQICGCDSPTARRVISPSRATSDRSILRLGMSDCSLHISGHSSALSPTELPRALRPRPSIVVLRSCAPSSTELHAHIVTMLGARCWRPYLR